MYDLANFPNFALPNFPTISTSYAVVRMTKILDLKVISLLPELVIKI